MKFRLLHASMGILLLVVVPDCFCGANGSSVKLTLNGADLTFDSDTGGLLRLAYPGVGNLLVASPERSSLIDLAYPHKDFEVLRLAARYSRGVKIAASSQSVEIHWDKLGLSRPNFSVEGSVSATVKITAAPDGRSLIFTGLVHNQSSNAVRQVLFPDLMGLVPVGKAENTLFRTSLNASRPFVDLAPNEDVEYAIHDRCRRLRHGISIEHVRDWACAGWIMAVWGRLQPVRKQWG
jgi:hypothetical protein